MAFQQPGTFLCLFLLIQLAGNTFAASPGVEKCPQLQAFRLPSLQDPTPLYDPVDDDEKLQPATLRQSKTSVRLHLHNIDSLIPSGDLSSSAAASTAGDILRLRLRRDGARAASLAAAIANATSGRFSAPVVSGLAQGSGEYFVRVGVGSPASAASLVVDTGSDLVWLQCTPCRRCYPQSDPVFSPTNSTSFSAISCDAPLCHAPDAANTGCDTRRGACLYEVSYGDGSVTSGELVKESLTFQGAEGQVRVDSIALGCGHYNEGLFVGAAGLLGLGKGKMSFPSQAGSRFGNKFSYCLVDRTSGGASARNRASTLVFGDDTNAAAVAYTPMVTNPKAPSFYYVTLDGISVGGARVSGVSAEAGLSLDAATGRGGVIVDSGTAVTRLSKPAYAALRDAFRAAMAVAAGGLTPSGEGGYSLFDTCFNVANPGAGAGNRRGGVVVRVPTLTLHFAGGADVELPPENYLIPVQRKAVPGLRGKPAVGPGPVLYCFAFAEAGGGVSIVGNIQQQGFRVVFDGANSRIGFVPSSC